jgi:hypothetical protein
LVCQSVVIGEIIFCISKEDDPYFPYVSEKPCAIRLPNGEDLANLIPTRDNDCHTEKRCHFDNPFDPYLTTRGVPVLSFWYNIYPIPLLDVSTASLNSKSNLGNASIGALVQHQIHLKPNFASKHQRPYRLPADKHEVKHIVLSFNH